MSPRLNQVPSLGFLLGQGQALASQTTSPPVILFTTLTHAISAPSRVWHRRCCRRCSCRPWWSWPWAVGCPRSCSTSSAAMQVGDCWFHVGHFHGTAGCLEARVQARAGGHFRPMICSSMIMRAPQPEQQPSELPVCPAAHLCPHRRAVAHDLHPECDRQRHPHLHHTRAHTRHNHPVRLCDTVYAQHRLGGCLLSARGS